MTSRPKGTSAASSGCWLALAVLAAACDAGAATMYVDGKLAADCKGTYSIAKRDASGADGDAFTCISKAAAVAVSGDTVLIREGVYHSRKSAEEHDVLQPRHSGKPGAPIRFQAFKDEKVVLGGDSGYPTDEISPTRCVLVLREIGYLTFENLTFEEVEGWVFARKCQHLTFKRCVFKDGRNAGKGCVKLIECERCRFEDCLFRNSGFDSLILEKSDRNVVEYCTFEIAAHALIAIRGGSYNVIRRNHLTNAYYVKARAEKLVEVYDIKPDRRGPDNPSYMPEAAYDSARFNLFEANYFGYTPFRPDAGAQPSALQYSGQHGLIRRNIFSNPQLEKPDADYPEGVAGGMAIGFRWGGSWEGWHQRSDGTGFWMGEGHEAGFVSGNRIYHNTFHGYDNGCVGTPSDKAMEGFLDPPPLENRKDSRQFHKRFEFKDNLIKNNLFMPEPYRAHINWAWKKAVTGKPLAWVCGGNLANTRFECNNVYAGAGEEVAYVVDKQNPPTGVAGIEARFPGTFSGNLQKDPQVADLDKRDYRLTEHSPMRDAAAPLTTASADGASKELPVADAGFFYDGFGIEGEVGDTIQLAGGAETARVVKVDYENRVLTLDKPLAWQKGQGVSLAYAGKAADVGALEFGSDAPSHGVRP
ncbi:MAG: right-handed parallel beta-helix repeat-containing protein [Planctomycetota bacterium]|nr:right-handed parallel beta-helix repeat-containing protein [Planctomycetota bacterium]